MITLRCYSSFFYNLRPLLVFRSHQCIISFPVQLSAKYLIVTVVMAKSLNVIALISGGKDSFLSILHCLHNDHRVIALANLYPEQPSETSDLNSYMYQTAGHAVIPLYERALGLPLYRRQISGSAINTERDYEPASSSYALCEDETESLLLLLVDIKKAHPEANAVCSGAIQSTYQRTRVESVAIRLGLVPLAYLWQYPCLPTPTPSEGGLLEDIAAVGLDARIVKVASGGIDENFLWGSLQDKDLRKKLEKHVGRFGGSVLGEGGEYETLVVDGPADIFKRRLEIGENVRQVVRGEGGDSWINFKLGSAVVVRDVIQSTRWKRMINIPTTWDPVFGQLFGTRDEAIKLADEQVPRGIERLDWPRICGPKESINKIRSTWTLNNAHAPIGYNTENQMLTIKERILDWFERKGLSVNDVVFTMIILRSMEDFTSVNRVYTTLFNKPNPPARLTVACGDGLPAYRNVIIHLRLDTSARRSRLGLHVQSRSYWAPENIGPYSQAIAVPLAKDANGASVVYTAGQIPLVPHSMETYGGNNQQDPKSELIIFWGQTCLALQHLWRVSKSIEITWWTHGIAFFVGETEWDVSRKAGLAWLAWKKMHEPRLWETEDLPPEDDEPHLWDKKYGGQSTFADDKKEVPLPAFQMRERVEQYMLRSGSNTEMPAFFAMQVDELPRGCKVEWHAPGLAGAKVNFTTFVVEHIVFHQCYVPEYQRAIATASIPAPIFPDYFLYLVNAASIMLGSRPHAIIYTTRPIASAAHIVPCKSIWGKDGKQLSAVIIVDFFGYVNHQPVREKDLMRVQEGYGIKMDTPPYAESGISSEDP